MFVFLQIPYFFARDVFSQPQSFVEHIPGFFGTWSIQSGRIRPGASIHTARRSIDDDQTR